jgi:hypothetical protein
MIASSLLIAAASIRQAITHTILTDHTILTESTPSTLTAAACGPASRHLQERALARKSIDMSLVEVYSVIWTYNSVTAPGAAMSTPHIGTRESPCGGDKAAAAHGQQLQTNRVQLLWVHMPTLLKQKGNKDALDSRLYSNIR